MHTQEQRINTQEILRHFKTDFIQQYNQNTVFIEVLEQLTRNTNPYIIIQELIERNIKLTEQLASTTKERSSKQVDLQKFYELEKKWRFGEEE